MIAQARLIETEEAQAFLASHFNQPAGGVALIGAGAWSRCFGFRLGADELVIRFGNYVDDFQKDQLAYRYAGPDLPIPQVFEIGRYDGGDNSDQGGYYAISTRANGVPLEQLDAAQWRATVPALVAALEAMRRADISAYAGVGGWGADGNAATASWSAHLLSVDADKPDRRTYGWRQRLVANSPAGEAAFRWGYELLQRVARDDVPRNLLHCDLMNRNVLVDAAGISAVFDWGCSLYGDHLYELAWFEFWAPWTPDLDIAYLRTHLEQCWRERGYQPADQATRLLACYLHIGLDHLAYNAYLGDWDTLLATAERMRRLATQP